MEHRRIVVLVGDSLLMDTVEASLEKDQEFGVMRMHTTVTDIAERLKSLCPDAIMFDWDAPHPEFLLSFLKDRPGVPLLGLDVTCSKVITLCSQEHITLTVDDLAKVVKLHTTDKTRTIEHSSDKKLKKHRREICQ